MNFKIAGVGAHVPARVQTAEELAPMVNRSPEWIHSRTGVHERRISSEPMSVLGAHAVREALGDGGPPDLLINASLTPMQILPDSSIFIQRELGFSGIPSFSIHATCLSFLVAVLQAGSLVASGLYRRIVVVSAEQGSVCRNFSEPESAVLIGDGAGAALITPADPGASQGLLVSRMYTFPEGAHLTELRGGGTRIHPNSPDMKPEDNLFHMSGVSIYRMARPRVEALLEELFAETGLTKSDIDLVVPHQMSGPGLRAFERHGFRPDQVVNIIGQYGNCIAASMPMALHHAVTSGRLQRGQRLLMVGTGAGLSVAGAILRW